MEREPSLLQMNNTKNSLAVSNLEAYAGSTKDINGKLLRSYSLIANPLVNDLGWPGKNLLTYGALYTTLN